jgi:alcohol dehydrogenase class IV
MVVEFYAPTKIIFGVGALEKAAPTARHFGRRALIVTGAGTHRAVPLIDALSGFEMATTVFPFPTEPTVEQVKDGTARAKTAGCDLVIGLGGGSAIDGAKAIAALLTNDGEMTRYLEVIGEGRPIENPPAPFIAIPTTAGAGAEVTRNAVLKVDAHRVKVSMRSPLMLPKVAIVDPQTTVELPKNITAATGLDALAQVLEPFVSRSASPITDAICRDGMRLAARSLTRAFENGTDLTAREEMCRVSLFGGLALANAKLGAVHGFAGPIGGMFDAPHGVICGLLLPPVIATNIAAIKKRSSDSRCIVKFDETARILTGNLDAVADDAANWAKSLGEALALPSLSTFGVTQSDVDEIVQKSKNASSMKGNPIELTDIELHEIIEAVL